MDEALKAAVLSATNIQAPTSTLGASQAPELAALFQSTYQLPQSSGAAVSGANIADKQVAAAKAAAAASRQKKVDLSDPSKYRARRKKDGGYDFFDPDGKLIDIATLTKRTGTRAAEWLKGSENPMDIQYLEDYNNLQDYIGAKLGGDKKKASKYEASKPELSKYQGRGGADKLINDFKKYYARFYEPTAWGERPGDGAFVPSPSVEDPYDLGGEEEL